MLPSYLDVLSILPNWDSNVVPHRMPKLSLNDRVLHHRSKLPRDWMHFVFDRPLAD